MAYWNENSVGMLEGIHDLLTDVYNFNKIGARNTKVVRAVELKDGSRLRLVAFIE